jgi:hypothetical protein
VRPVWVDAASRFTIDAQNLKPVEQHARMRAHRVIGPNMRSST